MLTLLLIYYVRRYATKHGIFIPLLSNKALEYRRVNPNNHLNP